MDLEEKQRAINAEMAQSPLESFQELITFAYGLAAKIAIEREEVISGDTDQFARVMTVGFIALKELVEENQGKETTVNDVAKLFPVRFIKEMQKAGMARE